MNDPRDDARRDWSDLAAASGTAQPWSPPSPLFEGPTPPPFPIQEAFPLALAETRDFVIALAIEVQVPVDLVAMLLAAITSACLAQKVLIEARDGWRETAVIWVLGLLESGERKSVIFRRMTDAIHQWEKDHAEPIAPEIAAGDIAGAIRRRDTPFRNPIGADAVRVFEALDVDRGQRSEALVHAVTGCDWQPRPGE